MGVPLRANSGYCYRWGQAGRVLWWLVIAQPIYLWVGFTSRAAVGSAAQRIYYRLHSFSWVFSWLFYYLLRDGVFRHASPYLDCTSERFSMPSLEVWLTTQLIVHTWLHSLYFGAPYREWVQPLVLWLEVSGLAFASGNNSLADIAVGTGLGMLMGLVCCYVIFAVLLPVQPLLYVPWWLWWNPLSGYHARYTTFRDKTLSWLHAPYLTLDQSMVTSDQGAQAARWAREWAATE